MAAVKPAAAAEGRGDANGAIVVPLVAGISAVMAAARADDWVPAAVAAPVVAALVAVALGVAALAVAAPAAAALAVAAPAAAAPAAVAAARVDDWRAAVVKAAATDKSAGDDWTAAVIGTAAVGLVARSGARVDECCAVGVVSVTGVAACGNGCCATPSLPGSSVGATSGRLDLPAGVDAAAVWTPAVPGRSGS